MYAIVSLLDPATDLEIRALWRRFEESCGLTGIMQMDLPHFSWVVADSFHFPPVKAVIAEVAREMPSLPVRTAGLGIFTGPLPVVYVALVKDAYLLRWHTLLWERVRPFAIGPSAHYHPENWVPHITLAYHEVDFQQLSCAISRMAYTPLNFAFTMHSLALIYHSSGEDGIDYQVALS